MGTSRKSKKEAASDVAADAPADGVPLEIVHAAMREPALKGRVFLCSKRREPLVCDGKVVGFVSPHQTKEGWRHGPIFVMPGYRRRGLVQAYYAAHADRLCVAFVPDANHASRRMHEQAGFKDWKRGPKGWFMRREPVTTPTEQVAQ